MNKKNTLINLGCRLNIYEGEIIKNHLNENNLKDITVINSCAVTAEAEKRVAYEIRKAKRDNPKNKIIVTGCAAQINPKKYDTIEEVDLVLGNKEKLLPNVWKNLNFFRHIQVDDILLEKKTVPSSVEKFDGKSRAYIEIQQGCDHRCTFCIIPYGRGNNRSVPAGEIVEKIKKIVNAQCEATKTIFKRKKIPHRHFVFKKNNESELGSAFTFFVLETILLAHLMKVNPYDQPAVEQVKIETKNYLK